MYSNNSLDNLVLFRIMIVILLCCLLCIYYLLFSVLLLSVLRGHSDFFIPATTANDLQGFSIPDCMHYIYFHILILEKEPVFSLLNGQC